MIGQTNKQTDTKTEITTLYIYIYPYMFVCYSWPNSWTKFADIFCAKSSLEHGILETMVWILVRNEGM